MPRKTVLRKLAAALGVSLEQLSQPDMIKISIEEGASDDDKWEVSIPKHLVSKIQALADEHGVSLEVMFVAELERARLFWEQGIDQGIEKSIASAQAHHKSLE